MSKKELKNKTRYEMGIISRNIDAGYNPYHLTRFELAMLKRR